MKYKIKYDYKGLHGVALKKGGSIEVVNFENVEGGYRGGFIANHTNYPESHKLDFKGGSASVVCVMDLTTGLLTNLSLDIFKEIARKSWWGALKELFT